MNFDDLRDQLREQMQAIWARIQDSSTYMQVQERYQGLDPLRQRLVTLVVGMGLVLLLLYIPYSYFSSSMSYMDDFLSKRELTRRLLTVSRSAGEPSPERLTAVDLRGRIESELRQFSLQSEQMGGLVETPHQAVKARVAPSDLREDRVEVKLNKLNLRQILDIGFRLQTLTESVKMVDFQVVPNAQDGHFFDVTMQLAAFSVPPTPTPAAAPGKKKGGA